MFGVVHVYTEEIKEIGELTHDNKLEYCNAHGYKFFEITSKSQLDLSKSVSVPRFLPNFNIAVGWSKIKLLIDILKQNKDIDWFFWIDADAIIMNPDIKLESLISDKAFFIVGRDCNGINVGTFFIRNCDRSIKFLEEIWQHGPEEGSWWAETEQGQLDLHGMKEEYFDGFWIVNNRQFNSYLHDCSPGPSPCGKYQDGDFIIHLPGVGNKLNILKQCLDRKNNV